MPKSRPPVPGGVQAADGRAGSGGAITFYQSIMRPAWRDLERRRTGDVWRRSHNRFFSNVVGPRFEHLCRTWVAGFAPAGTFPDAPGDVGHGVVNDPDRRTMHEIDVVVMAQSGGPSRRVLSIGEAKWGQVMGLGQLERLRRVATLLDRRGYDTRDIRLACYSGVGFDADLRTAAGRGEVLLVTPTPSTPERTRHSSGRALRGKAPPGHFPVPTQAAYRMPEEALPLLVEEVERVYVDAEPSAPEAANALDARRRTCGLRQAPVSCFSRSSRRPA